MSGEVRSWWQAQIAQFERDRFFQKRYAYCAKEPKALFDRIGEDLDNSNEAIRNIAYWALVLLTPELINLLHEKETRNPGWGDREGKDQKMVNEGLDGSKCILKHLHTKFVKEHHFKVRDGYKKDPRPFLKKAIKNWEKDRDRKLDREVPLDYEAALEIPDPAGSPEDCIIRAQTYWDLRREYCDGGIFRDGDKFDLFYTFNVDDRPLEEIRERWGISSDENVRKRKSRINKEMVARRDALFSFLLITGYERDSNGKIYSFVCDGKIHRVPQSPEQFEMWADQVKRCVQPGVWLNGLVADGTNAISFRTLTRSFTDAPGHIYLMAVHKDRQRVIEFLKTEPLLKHCNFIATCGGNFPFLNEDCLQYVNKLINPSLYECTYVYHRLYAYPTELSGLNEAVAEVRDDYETWLISTPFQDANRLFTSLEKEFNPCHEWARLYPTNEPRAWCR